MPFTARLAALLTLALSGCVPSIVVGDNPQQDDTTGAATDPGTPGVPAPDAPTTTATPATCGDGLVGDGELCDDGNDEPHDGCDLDCNPSGRLVWTTEPVDLAYVVDLAVGPAGQLVLSGWNGDGELLIALDPDGAEQWRLPVPTESKLAIDAAGRIFLGRQDGVIEALTADAQPLWTFEADHPDDIDDNFVSLAVTGDALLSLMVEDGPLTSRLVVRRHDLATGAVAWETRTPEEPAALGEDIVVLGQQILVVGRVHVPPDLTRGLFVVLDLDGDLLTIELAGDVAPTWTSADALGDGDFVLAGFGPGPDSDIERRGPDLLPIWSAPGVPSDTALHVAAGPGERIAVVCHDAQDGRSGVVRLLDGSGAPRWTSRFPAPQPHMAVFAAVAAFGPDSLIVAGHVLTELDDGVNSRAYVRRFALDD